MKADSILKTQRKRISSSSKLPPIARFTPLKRASKQNINKLQVSLQMIGHYSRPRAHTKGYNPTFGSEKKQKIPSFRLRTDSVGSQIIKENKNRSFAQNSPNQNKSDMTLENFNRNIKINKQYIQRQIKKRNESKNMQIRQNSVSTQKPQSSRKRRLLSENDIIFSQIQEIFKSKLPNNNKEGENKLNLSHIHQLLKLSRVNKNLRKLSPNKSIHELRKSFEAEANNDTSRLALKDQNNYHQWRRVQLCASHQSPRYKQSTFQLESQRLEEFALKNEVSLSKYFEYRKQLSMFKSKKMKTSIA